MLRTLLSFRGLILVFGLVAVGLPIALVGELGIVRALNAVNADIAATREGSLATDEVVQYQIDEETAIRGFAATGRPVFLEPYRAAEAQMPRSIAAVKAALPPATPSDVSAAIADLQRVNAEWQRSVAAPVLHGTRNHDALLLRGKVLIDRFRADARPLDDYFAARYAVLVARRTAAIRTTTTVSILALATIGLEVIAFAGVLGRMRRELDRERGFVDMLQEATAVRTVVPPHLAVGTAYRSATRGTRIGGDVYDVYGLDAHRTLLVIGDVSGKGLAAALDTTFVRFALRTLASEGHAPDEIVRRFDALYARAGPPPEAFVSLVAAIHDRRDGSLVYTNAGHEACFVRHGSSVEMLAPTGPIIGIGGIAFTAATTTLCAGDILVLATDGLTEARNPRGEMPAIATIVGWIATSPVPAPQAVVDDVIARVTRFTRGRIDDDLAILAVQPRPGT